MLQQYEQVFGSGGHAAVARGQRMVAMVDAERGRWPDAVQRLQAAVETFTRLSGEQHRWTGGTMRALGEALLGAGRLDEAERWLKRADAAQHAVLPPVHAAHVRTRWAQARLALARGGPLAWPTAERLLQSALKTVAAMPSLDRVPLDEVELTLARVLALQQRLGEATPLVQRVGRRVRDRLPADHYRRLGVEAVLSLPPFVSAPGPEEVSRTREVLSRLRALTGPQAAWVRDVEDGLRAAGAVLY